MEYNSEGIFCNHRKNQKSFHKKTKKLWKQVLELYKKEHESQGGVLDIKKVSCYEKYKNISNICIRFVCYHVCILLHTEK